MALEAVVFSQDSLITSYNCCSSSGNNNINININNNSNNNIFGGMNNDFLFSNFYPTTFKLEDTSSLKVPYNVGLFEVSNNTSNIYDYYSNNISCTSDLILESNVPQWDYHHDQHQQQYVPPSYSSPEENHMYLSSEAPPPTTPATPAETGGGSRRKRRRRSCKNKEEVEHQRMTHIAVERNRRKQMNEYLAVIRSLMPPSYVQRGDQASIVGGAINYVKELEQLLQSKEAQKTSYKHNHHDQPQQPPSPQEGSRDDKNVGSPDESPLPFADFFSFPQYSTRSKLGSPTQSGSGSGSGSGLGISNSSVSSSNSGVGDIEVTMVESHANVKILAKKQSKQLVKLIAGFQGLRLNVLHLNVTTVDSFVLYSLSLKVEEGCQLNLVDDIAAAANHILKQIQEEASDNLVE